MTWIVRGWQCFILMSTMNLFAMLREPLMTSKRSKAASRYLTVNDFIHLYKKNKPTQSLARTVNLKGKFPWCRVGRWAVGDDPASIDICYLLVLCILLTVAPMAMAMRYPKRHPKVLCITSSVSQSPLRVTSCDISTMVDRIVPIITALLVERFPKIPAISIPMGMNRATLSETSIRSCG